jgi:hypothetical protein
MVVLIGSLNVAETPDTDPVTDVEPPCGETRLTCGSVASATSVTVMRLVQARLPPVSVALARSVKLGCWLSSGVVKRCSKGKLHRWPFHPVDVNPTLRTAHRR